MKLKIPKISFGMGRAAKPEAAASSEGSPPAPAAAPSKPSAPAKPAKPLYRGTQIEVDGGDGKSVKYRGWFSDHLYFWILVEGPSPADLQQAIFAKWGQDGIDGVTNEGVRQRSTSGVCFCTISKRGMQRAPKLREAWAEQDRKEQDAQRERATKEEKRKADQAARAAKKAQKQAPATPEVAPAAEPVTTEAE